MEKLCLECGTQIRGRSDKKFCDDSCRNAHNNKLNQDTNKYVRRVNSILKKNRRILSEFVEIGKKSVHKGLLIEQDFNFSFFTDIYRTQKQQEYKFCYDFGYLEISESHILIVKRKDYLISKSH